MNWIKKYWWIALVLIITHLLAYGIGWGVEAWNSPLGPHLCYSDGAEMTQAFMTALAQWVGPRLIFVIPIIVVLILVILLSWRIWRMSNRVQVDCAQEKQ